MAPAKKPKAAKLALKPPTSLEEAAALHLQVEQLLIDEASLEATEADALKKLKGEFDELRKKKLDQAKETAKLVIDWLREHQNLLPKDRSTLELPRAGSAQWYNPPKGLTIENAKETLALILSKGQTWEKYVRRVPEINKEELGAAPQAILDQLPGVTYGSTEQLVLRFLNTDAKVQCPAKGRKSISIVKPEKKK